jgi:hypothetical protein
MKPVVKEIKPYTQKELSTLYGVCKQTFSKWLIPFKGQIGERNGHFYSVEQVKTIFHCLGVPESLDDAA